MIRLGKLEGTMLLSFLLFFCFSLLYIFRFLDKNTLVSWKWVLGDQGFTTLLPCLFSSVILSLFFSFFISFEKYQLPVLIILSGIAVFPLWNEPELLLDSGRYFLQAKNLSEYGIIFFFKEWGHTITAWTDMPLSPFLFGLAMKLGNESREAIQLLNTIIFFFTIVVTSRIGAILWNKELGFYAGLILAGMPYLLTQVPQMLVDVHAMFFHALAFYCFLEAMRKKNRFSLILSSATITLAVFVKYSVWPLITLLPLSGFLFHQQGMYNSTFKRMLFIFIPAVFVSIILISFKFEVFAEQLRTLLSYQRPALKLWGEGIAGSLLFHCHPFIVIISLFSIFRAHQRQDKRYVIILLYCSVIVILQIQRIRYMIPLMPFIALMASYGLACFKEKMLKRYAGSLIVSSSLAILFFIYLPFFQTTSMMNIKKAGEALNQLETESVQVTVLPQRHSEGSTFIAIPLLDLFTKKLIVSPQKWPNNKPDYLSDHSPLLFTWLLKKPSYYERHDEKNKSSDTIAIIGSEDPASEDLVQMIKTSQVNNVTSFSQHSNVFRYRTFISILD